MLAFRLVTLALWLVAQIVVAPVKVFGHLFDKWVNSGRRDPRIPYDPFGRFSSDPTPGLALQKSQSMVGR